MFSQKKTAADLVVVAFISSSYRLTFFYFYGGEVLSLWCSQFWELLETICGDFWFFSLSKEKKSAHEKRKKKSQWFKKNSLLKKGKSGWFQAPKVDTSPMKSHKARHYVKSCRFSLLSCAIYQGRHPRRVPYEGIFRPATRSLWRVGFN